MELNGCNYTTWRQTTYSICLMHFESNHPGYIHKIKIHQRQWGDGPIAHRPIWWWSLSLEALTCVLIPTLQQNRKAGWNDLHLSHPNVYWLMEPAFCFDRRLASVDICDSLNLVTPVWTRAYYQTPKNRKTTAHAQITISKWDPHVHRPWWRLKVGGELHSTTNTEGVSEERRCGHTVDRAIWLHSPYAR